MLFNQCASWLLTLIKVWGPFFVFSLFLVELDIGRSSSFGGPHYPITIIGSTLLHDCKQWVACFYVSDNSSSRQGQHRKEGHPQAITKASAGPIPVMPLSWGVTQLDIPPRDIGKNILSFLNQHDWASSWMRCLNITKWQKSPPWQMNKPA
jgi:hypothetical protein